MLNSGKKIRALHDKKNKYSNSCVARQKKKYSNSCVVRKNISERNKKP